MIQFDPKQLEFMDNNRNLIDSGNLKDITSQADLVFGRPEDNLSSRKLIFLICYLLHGPSGFRLRLENRGASRSLARANAGQSRLRIYLDALDSSYDNGYCPLTFMKGTMREEQLNWGLLNVPTRKTIRNITGDSVKFEDVLHHLGKEYMKTGGKY